MKKVISVVMIMVLMLSLASCGAASPKGKYTATVGENVMGTIDFSDDEVTLELTVPVKIPKTTGTFKMDGDKVIATFDDGSTREFVYDAEEKTVTLGGGIVFKK